MHLTIFQDFIDIIRGKKRTYLYFNMFRNAYKKRISKLSEKYKNGEKIKVAFLHMYATSIQDVCVFDEMLKDDVFEPYFIVNPDVYRSKENFDYNYNRTKNELIEKYGNERVLDGYNYEKDEYVDYTNNFDIATTNNPYDAMAHQYFKIKYWALKKIPMFYISYFYMGRCHVTVDNLINNEFSYLWTIFAENKTVLDLAKKYQTIKGKNIVITGYPKMDKLSTLDMTNNNDKKIVIIAPHHTIQDNELSLGGFLQYYDAILQLPKKYPEITFVFRPHPMLIENLNTLYWGEEKTKQYMDELLSNENVIYSTEGDYLELFAKSDALIHDCGSFLAEYLYTDKPCAYLYKKGLNADKVWTELGKGMVDCHYIVNNSVDLDKFIEDVVIKGDDSLKEKRKKWFENNIKMDYPNVTKNIYKILKNNVVSGK